MSYSKEIIKAVTRQVIAMYENNVLQDCGAESFRGWCENGDVFQNNPDLTPEQADQCCAMMVEIESSVDELTFNWLNTDCDEDEEEG